MSHFPRPEGFVQSLRMRRRGLPDQTPLLVVEGPNDRQALFPFLAAEVQVVAAEGRDQVLRAFDTLELPLRSRMAFIIDCDGNIGDRYKGHPDLVITTNRDIEADLIFELQAFERVGADLLANKVQDSGEAAAHAAEALDCSAELATRIGIVHAAARGHQIPTRIRDQRSGKKRKFRLTDLGTLPEALTAAPDIPSLEDIVTMIGYVTQWTEAEHRLVLEDSERLTSLDCESHGTRACVPCQRRRHCNGHHFVDGISIVLKARHNTTISPRELNRALRVAAQEGLVKHWDVAKRLERWGLTEGITQVFDPPA